MIYSFIGDTHINCSKIVLGTDYFGKLIPEEDAYKLMDFYCLNGGNMLDTAHVYSDYIPGEKHMSEKVIGRWLRKTGARSNTGNKLYISTKGGFPELDDFHKSRLSYENVRDDLYSSLDLLGLDSIDMYWLHRDNEQIPVSEIADWMHTFYSDGLIKNYGVSNWTCDRINKANKYAKEKGYAQIKASQIRWSLAVVTKSEDKDDTLVAMTCNEYCKYKENQIPVFAFSSQAKGFFSKIQVDEDGKYIMPEGKAGIRYSNEDNLNTFSKLRRIQNQYPDCTIAQLALLPIIGADINGYAIVGCKNADHLSESMKAADIINKIDMEYINGELNIYETGSCYSK